MLNGVPSLLAVGGTVLMLAIAMWTVLPGPTLATLGLAIGIPELSFIIVWFFAAIGAGLSFVAHGGWRIAAIVISALTMAALVWPSLAFLATRPQAEALLSASGIPPLRAHALVGIDVTRDIPVPLRDGTALALDLYRPQLPGMLPLLVTMYGGAWMFGSRAEDASLARWYAARGYAVAVIDYRHAPEFRFPTQINDVDDALGAIARNASAWHVDRERVALLGRSAGAQLALLAGERAQPVSVRAVIAYYAPTNLIGGWETPPRPDPAGVRNILENYLGGPPDAEHLAAYRAASPLEHAHAGMPPVLAIIGDRDELVLPVFQRNFAARLDALHVRNVAIELPWSNHAFDAVNGLASTIAHDATLRFLDALL